MSSMPPFYRETMIILKSLLLKALSQETQPLYTVVPLDSDLEAVNSVCNLLLVLVLVDPHIADFQGST